MRANSGFVTLNIFFCVRECMLIFDASIEQRQLSIYWRFLSLHVTVVHDKCSCDLH